MKKCLAVAILVALAVFSVGAAATGTEVIYEGGDTQNLRCAAYLDGWCYLFLSRDDIEAVSDSGERVEYKWADNAFNPKDNVWLELMCTMSDGEKLFALVVENEHDGNYEDTSIAGASLREVVFEGGVARLADGVKLDWSDMVEADDDWEYSRQVEGAFIQDGFLAFGTYGYNGFEVVVYDLETSEREVYEIENLSALTAYKDGCALGIMYEREDMEVSAAFAEVDLSTGETRPLSGFASLNNSFATSVCYDAGGDGCYFIANGELWSAPAMQLDKAYPICAVKNDGTSALLSAAANDGYVIVMGYNMAMKYNTDPAAHPTKKLVVSAWGEDVDRAEREFSQKHQDIDVVINYGGMDVISAMTSQSHDVDIYFLEASSGQYASLFERGFMADLSSSDKLCQLTDGMYETIRNAVTKDGKLCALPIMTYNSMFGFSAEAFERAGLEQGDMPTTWAGLFELFNRFGEELGEDSPVSVFNPSCTVPNLRAMFTGEILKHYMIYISEPGAELSFDSPVLRDIFAALDEVDFVGLGVPEEQIGDSFSWSGDEVLFSERDGISADSWNDTGSKPLALALGEDIPAFFPCELYVLFVNPYSQNIGAAIEFLECVADNLDEMFLIHAFPGNNEPVIDPYAEEALKERGDYIASLKSALETATDENRLDIEEQIKLEEESIEQFTQRDMYRASPSSIANYRRYADMMRVSLMSAGLGVNTQELGTLMQQYADEAITSDELIRGIDQKLRMILLEGM